MRRLNWMIRHHGRRPDAHLSPPETGPLFPAPLAEQEADEARLAPMENRYFINSDLRPIGYYYTVVLWHTLTRTGQARIFDWLSKVRLWWALPVAGGALACLLLLRVAARRTGSRADARFALVSAILTTGFSTMVLQIAILFSFQSVYGFVYEMVGFIVALFMAGLAAGAALTHRLVETKGGRRSLATVQLLVALYAVVLALGIPLSTGVGSPWATFVLFSVLTFGGGVLNGAGFPLAASCCMVMGAEPDAAAGTVYGNELVGGCIGAALAGVVVAPILGVVACCLLAGIMNAAALGLILLSGEESWLDTTTRNLGASTP